MIPDLKRIVIIGNSGSGKSFLAKRLSQKLKHELIHLDQLFWEPGGFTQKRPNEIVTQKVLTFSNQPAWIMEGVFGELAAIAIKKATTLIFMDQTWENCRANLLQRGRESATEASFNELLTWAQAYWDRQNLNSFTGHNNLFDAFEGFKVRITSNAASDEFQV